MSKIEVQKKARELYGFGVRAVEEKRPASDLFRFQVRSKDEDGVTEGMIAFGASWGECYWMLVERG